ncbi:helix-turn-helix domain-containing protein [Nonomuraea sp. NN258]|uniref:GlxA family transcriptional regulator n=1 Tax=Nonomuraea antri TaxID=2730852 RepID=UPI0015697D90|nr:DJ-1/PfpI family protein [Nonomuraea antri]NRQ30874.1 helix-turn-helix domain-containing protein [Nonomuraea antri]
MAAAHLVVITVYDGVELLDVAGPLEVFSTADRLLNGDPPGYRTLVAGPRAGLVRCAGGASIAADVAWEDLPREIGTLVVPGGLRFGAGGVQALVAEPLVGWLAARAARDAARIASVCAGAHLLAAAGLLDGRRATTHWATAAQLAAEHPEVRVEPDAIYVRDEHVWTSAGVSTGIDLALALVAHDHHAELARRVARWLVMYMRRPGGQSQFSELLAYPSATDAQVARLQAWIPGHLTEDLSNDALARRTNLSVRHFSRLFRQQVGVTPAQYVESVRLDAAARQLVHTGNGLKAIANAVGLGSVETFHRLFRERFGVTPAAYRERFTAGEA